MSRYDLTDFGWRVIEPLLPNKPRGVSRVDDRRVLNGIFRVLRSGAPWRDQPERHGPRTTCYSRFVGWPCLFERAAFRNCYGAAPNCFMASLASAYSTNVTGQLSVVARY